ncbi:MAG: hypothetical protein QE271_08775 [Bacteriovoracaceae bacterium]|nr:hypothetical protein [Bacteriovoracaceae bacterium]
MKLKSITAHLLTITSFVILFASITGHSKTTKPHSKNSALEVIRNQLLELDPEVFNTLDQEEQEGLTQSAMESIINSSSPNADSGDLSKKHSLTLREIIDASREYRAYKKTHRHDIRDFKKSSRTHFKRIQEFTNSHGTFTSADQAALENQYFEDLEKNKIAVGLKLDCRIDWAVQFLVVNLSWSERCYRDSNQYNNPVYNVEFRGIGPGLGIQGAQIGTVCLLDNRFKNFKSVNIGLRGNLSFGIGFNGGLSFGMNGVCASYGVEIGGGAGLAVGSFTVTQR